jgi:AbiV family abortive infection protein
MSENIRHVDTPDPIMELSSRLRKDALLLLEHGRFSSAYALSILAMEEQGKMILKMWNDKETLPKPKKRTTAHLKKQNAVASLLLTNVIFNNFKVIRTDDLQADQPKIMTEQLAKLMAGSKEAQIFRYAEMGAYEKMKHLAFYHDEWFVQIKLSPESFERDDVKGILEIAEKIEELLANEAAMIAGRAIYMIKLERE